MSEGDTHVGDRPSRASQLREEVPVLGYRNYWYPALMSRRVRRKPVGVRLLGEDIVIFRSLRGIHALADRCAHRGARLSKGHLHFEGTITCAYHGWTFDGYGKCVAAITEGPGSSIPGKARVRAYPAEEQHGVIWVYIGELPAPPRDEVLPKELCIEDTSVFAQAYDWNSNWRLSVENFSDPAHAYYLHRNALIMLFRKVPVWAQAIVQDSPDGAGFILGRKYGPLTCHFPQLGKFPPHVWWRVFASMEKKRRALSDTIPGAQAEVRLPGFIRITRPRQGMIQIQWSVPIDEHHSRQFLFTTRRISGIRSFLFQAYCRFFYSWAHNKFFTTWQDGWISEDQQINSAMYSEEKLSINDVGVIRWRQLAARARGRDRTESD